jgi:oligopeptide transport system ATP-binding protein
MAATTNASTPILDVNGLETTFSTPEGAVRAVNSVSFQVRAGEAVGIVGESGSGKSQVFMSIMGLLAANGRARGSVRFKDTEILGQPPHKLNQIRGVRMSMIFQDPMTSLNPYLTVARQMTEVLIEHKGMSMADARKASIALLDRVQIPEAAQRFDMYPHEFSGGMRQRVMIAMALLCQPELLIADEPTTALDVTVQAQILDLIRGLQRDFNMALTLITHDMGVIAGMCERVMVMYGGRVVESAPASKLFHDPQHPYSAGLLRSMPRLDETMHGRLTTIAGQPPNLQRLPTGCAFRNRCDRRIEVCATELPPLRAIAPERSKACHLPAL